MNGPSAGRWRHRSDTGDGALGYVACQGRGTIEPPLADAVDKPVVLYNAYWCPYCRQVRALLGHYHIRYQLVEVTAEPGQSMALKRFGDTSVPRTVIGGTVVIGYEPERIKQLLCLN